MGAKEYKMSLLTQKEVCALLKVSRTTLLRLRNEAGLPYVSMGTRLRFDEEAVSEWLKQNALLSEQTQNQPENEETGNNNGGNSNE